MLVVRQDGSGTTYAFSSHLSAISAEWRDQGPGVGTLLSWPGNTMRARGNEGVAGRIKVSEGSIGYVEYHFAKRLGLPMAHLQNRAGRFIAPGETSGQTALTRNVTQMPANLRLFMPDPEGEDAYPIVSFSWLLLYDRYQDPAKAAALKKFVAWGLTEGQNFSRTSRLHPAARRGRIPFPRRAGADPLIGSRPGRAPSRRVDLAAVEASLRRLQGEFDAINTRLSAHREPMSDQVVENMIAGYAFVDALQASDTDIFALGNHKGLLELNSIVLCGTDPAEREAYARHREASERRFYEEREGGIRDLVEWHAGQANESVWNRAAGAYVRMLSDAAALHRGQSPDRCPADELHPAGRRATPLRVVAGERPLVLRTLGGD